MNPNTSTKLIAINDQRGIISLITPILFRANDKIAQPKIIPIPIATPVRLVIGIPAAKYFNPIIIIA